MTYISINQNAWVFRMKFLWTSEFERYGYNNNYASYTYIHNNTIERQYRHNNVYAYAKIKINNNTTAPRTI